MGVDRNAKGKTFGELGLNSSSISPLEPRTPVDDYPDQAEGPEEGEHTQTLAALGQAFMKAASGDKTEQTAAMATLHEILPKLDFKRFPELRDDPTIEAFLDQISEERASSSDLPPGSVIDKGKPTERIKEWTEHDLKKDGNPVVTFTPMETLPVIWNGLRCQLTAGEEITTFKCFKDEYDKHVYEMKWGAAHARWLMHPESGFLPHPDMATPDGLRARAAGTSGTYQPSAGLFDVGTSKIPAEALKPEGESGKA